MANKSQNLFEMEKIFSNKIKLKYQYITFLVNKNIYGYLNGK